MKRKLFLTILAMATSLAAWSENITFADANVKAICVQNWDTNGDGELSKTEATAVKYLYNEFKGNTSITSFDELQYFTGLAYIYEKAFYNCENLKSITLPNNLQSIVAETFRGCAKLESIVLPSLLTSIPDRLFYGCTNLSSVIALGDIAWIGIDAFWGTQWLQTGYEQGVKYLGKCAVAYDGTVKDITFKADTKLIANGIFESVNDLGKIELPAGVSEIPNMMFYRCEADEVVIPSNIQLIRYNAFGYAKIRTLTIEDGEETLKVGSYHDDPFGAFRYASIGTATISRPMKNYSYYNIDDSGRQYAHPFGQAAVGRAVITMDMDISDLFNGCRLGNVKLPANLSVIGDNAFMYKDKKFSYNYDYSYTSYFDDTELKEIEIPSTVTNIGEYAFLGHYMSVVKVNNPIPVPITAYTFTSRDSKTLYVPAGSKATYAAADYWKNFKEIIEVQKCATPTISFVEGKLHFECETEGVQFHYEFTTPDSEEGIGNDIAVTPVYIIKVYASKEGYTDSDVATSKVNVAGLKGDVTDDGVVDIADAVALLDVIMNSGGVSAPKMEAPDIQP